ncbi:MAG: hypothetical protein [Caudoviricetes sp.]|nr:MAG: hypothetical protein [Caudoviricetes sp.]
MIKCSTSGLNNYFIHKGGRDSNTSNTLLGYPNFKGEPEGSLISNSGQVGTYVHVDGYNPRTLVRSGNVAYGRKTFRPEDVQYGLDVFHSIVLPRGALIDHVRVHGFDRNAKNKCDPLNPVNSDNCVPLDCCSLKIEIILAENFYLEKTQGPIAADTRKIGFAHFTGEHRDFFYQPTREIFGDKPILQICGREHRLRTRSVSSIGFKVLAGKLASSCFGIEVVYYIPLDREKCICNPPPCFEKPTLIQEC